MMEELEKWWDFRQHYESKVAESAMFLATHGVMTSGPEFAVVLGSGLGGLADRIDVEKEIPYSEIPHFPQPTVKGHEGKLVVGKLEGVPIIGMKGRKHFYEVADSPFGTGPLRIVHPINVMAEMCVPNFFVTNAAGGITGGYLVGDAMIIDSHISYIPNPLLGRVMDFDNVDLDSVEKVPRFVPMDNAYDSELRSMLLSGGMEHHEYMHSGTYVAMTGPSYETKGEILALKSMGADAVGMSTAPEVIAARSRGMRCVGMSCITNVMAPDGENAANHDEVKEILDKQETKDRFADIVSGFFAKYRETYMEKR